MEKTFEQLREDVLSLPTDQQDQLAEEMASVRKESDQETIDIENTLEDRLSSDNFIVIDDYEAYSKKFMTELEAKLNAAHG